MPQKISIVWLQNSLINSARSVGKLKKRSPTEQIEYWAHLGQFFQQRIDQEGMLDILSGVKKIKLVEAPTIRIDPESLFYSIECRRDQQILAPPLLPGEVRYQSSGSDPDLIEQISEDEVRLGRFEGGVFRPLKNNKK